jgi:osmotically inducible protein OsmC
MAVERRAKATWEGDLMGGSGEVSTESGVVQSATVKWSSRAEQADENTSPEELIAAAHATCVSMALAHGLAQGGPPAKRLETRRRRRSTGGEGFRLTTMRLSIAAGRRPRRGGIPPRCEGRRRTARLQALKGNVEVTLDAALA